MYFPEEAMLKIGNEKHEVIENLTGMSAMLDPALSGWQRQMWRMELGFMPLPGRSLPWDPPQIWQIVVYPIGFLTVTDWRDLAGRDWFEGDMPIMTSLENRCAGGRGHIHSVNVGDCVAVRRNGKVFTLELDGEVETAEGYDGPTGELQGLIEMPFSSIKVSVPANARDPVAAARALAARELGWQGKGRSYWKPFDPEKAGTRPRSFHDSHKVWLEVEKDE